ncbi:MAG: thioredoxin family protein [Verrucomicrobiales bacterium]|nr:thioredoxin family protein [Verrucomicrobiales bacterium]
MKRFSSPQILLCFFLFSALFSTSVTAQEPAAVSKWTQNYEAAVKSAQEQKRPMILLFTASSYVKICEILDRDVLYQTEFTDAVAPSFELVRLEFPRNDPQDPKVKAQNLFLRQAYRIQGYPTLLVTDSEGRPFGMNGYQPVTAADYAKVMNSMLDTLKVRDSKFAEAEKAEGVKKAKLLAEGIPELPGNLLGRYYREQIETVIANDPENTTGVVDAYQRLLADVDYSKEMETLAQDVQWTKMLKRTDQYISDHNLEGVEKQRALMNKVGVYQQLKDLPSSVKILIEIVNINPETDPGKMAAKSLDRIRAQKLEADLAK